MKVAVDTSVLVRALVRAVVDDNYLGRLTTTRLAG